MGRDTSKQTKIRKTAKETTFRKQVTNLWINTR